MRQSSNTNTTKILGTVLLAISAALALATPSLAQATASERARDIIAGFAARSSLPPVETQAKLDAAGADVCLEVGNQLAALRPEEATRLCGHIGRSNNGLAHAALLVGMTGNDEAVRGICLDTLVSLKFGEVLAMGAASKTLQPNLFDRLRTEGIWEASIRAKVRELCSQDERGRASPVVIHQQACLALVVDLYGGGNGFQVLVDELLKMLVGEGPASDLPKEEETPPSVPEGADAPLPAADGLSDQERERMRLMQERRKGAIDMFKRVLILDPDGFFQLGQSATYERRVERAAQFWKKLGGVESPTNTPEERAAESAQLIRNDYVREHGPVRSWRSLIQWVQREAPTRDEKVIALILMDELCDGVQVEGEKPTPVPGEDAPPPEEPAPMIPAISGATLASKVEDFLKLDLRTGQRPRTRAIRKAFEDKFLKPE